MADYAIGSRGGCPGDVDRSRAQGDAVLAAASAPQSSCPETLHQPRLLPSTFIDSPGSWLSHTRSCRFRRPACDGAWSCTRCSAARRQIPRVSRCGQERRGTRRTRLGRMRWHRHRRGDHALQRASDDVAVRAYIRAVAVSSFLRGFPPASADSLNNPRGIDVAMTMLRCDAEPRYARGPAPGHC